MSSKLSEQYLSANSRIKSNRSPRCQLYARTIVSFLLKISGIALWVTLLSCWNHQIPMIRNNCLEALRDIDTGSVRSSWPSWIEWRDMRGGSWATAIVCPEGRESGSEVIKNEGFHRPDSMLILQSPRMLSAEYLRRFPTFLHLAFSRG